MATALPYKLEWFEREMRVIRLRAAVRWLWAAFSRLFILHAEQNSVYDTFAIEAKTRLDSTILTFRLTSPTIIVVDTPIAVDEWRSRARDSRGAPAAQIVAFRSKERAAIFDDRRRD